MCEAAQRQTHALNVIYKPVTVDGVTAHLSVADIRSISEAGASAYHVSLPAFEGPLDLLLHLCQKHELDILDIPISFVTEKYLEYLDAMAALDIDAVDAAIGETTAGILIEPIMGEGGMREVSWRFLQDLRALADEKGILLLLDEVQTGVGRTGKLWGYEHSGVEQRLHAVPHEHLFLFRVPRSSRASLANGGQFLPELGDERGWVPVDKNTLKHSKFENIWAIGDTTNIPISKSGSVAHYEASVAADAIMASVKGEATPKHTYDGKVMCFLETGQGQATTIQFDYDHPPVSPTPARRWHWAKALFNKTYWHTVPQGRLP